MMINVLYIPSIVYHKQMPKFNQATGSDPDLLLGQQGQPCSSEVQNLLCLGNDLLRMHGKVVPRPVHG